MARFRYYIADVMNGTVLGTDDRGVADGYAAIGPDAFVVDTEEGNWLMDNGADLIVDVPVEEALPAETEEESDDEPTDSDEPVAQYEDDPEDSRN